MISPRSQRHSLRALADLAFVLLVAFSLRGSARAQQTVFNVPSGDVMERGKVYGESDISYMHSDGAASFTPRVVWGVGRKIEAGLNVPGLGTPGDLQTTLSPAIKWKTYDGGSNGWSFLVGDTLFVPVQNRTYEIGNYVYAELTKTWHTKTRTTVGAFHFTRHVISGAPRAGGQFAIEQPLNQRMSIAADWFTGNHTLGYVTPGAIIRFKQKLTCYLAYQIGNRGALNGNHQALVEFGWNFN